MIWTYPRSHTKQSVCTEVLFEVLHSTRGILYLRPEVMIKLLLFLMAWFTSKFKIGIFVLPQLIRIFNSDLLQNPLIVPLKKLQYHEQKEEFGVLDVVWHPAQPWLFSVGADATVRLYT